MIEYATREEARGPAPSIITGNNFRLTDRIKIQCQKIRDKDYVVFGRLTAIHWAGQRDTTGYSESRPRYGNAAQIAIIEDAVARRILSERQADAMKPFSEKQNILWQSTTLDWLDATRGPIIARSKDHRDWILPFGLTPLPRIPDPRFVSKHSLAGCPKISGCEGCIAPRIAQLYMGCPIVGDRVQHKITARNGYVMGVLHPVLELSVVAWTPDGHGHFVRLRAGEDNVDRSRPALLLDDEDRGFFVGGGFS